MATGAGLAISSLWRTKRPLLRANLRRVLGPGVDDERLERLVTASFVSYARYWVESARVGALRSDQVESSFTIEGFERFRLEMAKGRGVVIVLPHVGSWETGGRWLAQQGYPMTTVGELLEPPELFEWFVSQRAALGLTVLAPGPDTTVKLLDTLRSGRVVGLLADRDLAGNGDRGGFFGEKTTLPGGPALIALRSGAPLMTCAIYQRPEGRYHAILQPPLDSDAHRLHAPATCSASPRTWRALSRASSVARPSSGTCSSRTGPRTGSSTAKQGHKARGAEVRPLSAVTKRPRRPRSAM